MNFRPEQTWFEMRDVRKRSLSTAVWVPLRQCERLVSEGPESRPGRIEEFLAVGSVAVPPDRRQLVETFGWHELGLMHNPEPFAFEDGRYKQADVFLRNDRDEIGIDLVLVQRVNSLHPNIWHVNQDLVMALGLIRDGDSWVRPDEGYIEVIRERKEDDGNFKVIDIKAEFLRDYLSARGLSLRVASYRQRMAIVDDPSYLKWAKAPLRESKPHDRFETRVFEIDESGGPFGGEVAVFHAWRTDVDEEADIPHFDAENDENTAGRSSRFQRDGGEKFQRVEGELWREEWIEPLDRSERVRRDDPAEQLYVSTGAAGERQALSELNNEDVGRYLWFRPQVVPALLGYRGSNLGWYTRDTGHVGCSPDYNNTHFGMNRIGLIGVYAYDIARLPIWQQRIWVGYNTPPDGGVSAELLASQQRADPAETVAPEEAFVELLKAVDARFEESTGRRLLSRHEAQPEILRRVHRFRGLDTPGLLALAKDVARLTADSIDTSALSQIVTPPKNERWGSLKHLEKVLATKVAPEKARSTLTPLVGIYELRLGDAHLPSSQLAEAFELVGISTDATPISQAFGLIAAACDALQAILDILNPRSTTGARSAAI